MVFELFLGAYGVLGLVHLADALYRRRVARRRLTRWREAAREAGLGSIDEIGGAVRSYSGKLLVRLGEHPDWPRVTEVEVAGPGLAPRLTLRPEAGDASREVEVGDDAFDREVGVQGPPAVALALLDATTRQAVRTLMRGPFEVEGHGPLRITGRVERGLLRIWVPPSEGQARLPAVLRAGIALAARLVAPSDLAPRLASNLAVEPYAGVRRRILLTLVREFPDHEATRGALRAARDDADAEVRLRAGIALGAEGRETLLAVAAGENAGDAAGARAVAALGRSLALEEVTRLLEKADRACRPATATACLGVLGTHGSEATPLLVRVLGTGALGEAAARALGATADASAEAPLLRALAEGQLAVRRAAAKALGRVGTRNAVAGLREAEAEAELRVTARQAIAQIHSRLAGAGQGQLSLAGGEAGRLSIAEDESGRLSLSEAPATKPVDPGRASG
jgi:HEAT repeat protein